MIINIFADVENVEDRDFGHSKSMLLGRINFLGQVSEIPHRRLAALSDAIGCDLNVADDRDVSDAEDYEEDGLGESGYGIRYEDMLNVPVNNTVRTADGFMDAVVRMVADEL